MQMQVSNKHNLENVKKAKPCNKILLQNKSYFYFPFLFIFNLSKITVFFQPSGFRLVVKGSQLWVPPWVRFSLATLGVLSGKKIRILRAS